MRWGLTFLAWVATGLWLANGCIDYVRVWQSPPPGFSRERIAPHLEACGRKQATRFGLASLGFVAFYYGTGWWISRREAGADPDA